MALVVDGDIIPIFYAVLNLGVRWDDDSSNWNRSKYSMKISKLTKEDIRLIINENILINLLHLCVAQQTNSIDVIFPLIIILISRIENGINDRNKFFCFSFAHSLFPRHIFFSLSSFCHDFMYELFCVIESTPNFIHNLRTFQSLNDKKKFSYIFPFRVFSVVRAILL